MSVEPEPGHRCPDPRSAAGLHVLDVGRVVEAGRNVHDACLPGQWLIVRCALCRRRAWAFLADQDVYWEGPIEANSNREGEGPSS